MPDNKHIYGLRWYRDQSTPCPDPIEYHVATGYQATNDGAGFNVDLNVGDPVKKVSDGSIALATTTNSVLGVIVGFKPYWDGSVMKPTNRLPGGTAWGTVWERRSIALVVPVLPGQLWEIDADDKTTATTFAGWETLVGLHCTLDCPGDQTDSSKPKADPLLDISLAATTATLVWTIRGISQTVANQYVDGLYYKVLVSVNHSQMPGQAATVIAGV